MGQGLYRSQKCRDQSDLRVSVSRLRGAVVLVDHAAKHLAAPHRRVKRHDDRLVLAGWPLLPGLMRTMPVIVPRADSQDRPQVGFAVDQHPVSALGPYGPYPAFGITICPGVRGGDFTIRTPSLARTSSNMAVNLASRSRTYQVVAPQLMTVRNGMYGQAHHFTTGISPAPGPAGRNPGSGGLSVLWRGRSGHLSQDTLARHEIIRP
jgi:hypothetical protein